MSEAASTSPPEQPTASGSQTGDGVMSAVPLTVQEKMTYAERRMSGQAVFGYDTGRRRTSSFGSYTRVVVVAVDPSDNAKQAFDCKFYNLIHVLLYVLLCVYSVICCILWNALAFVHALLCRNISIPLFVVEWAESVASPL